MPVNVYVTLDLYLRDWHLADGGELWLCAQPHVLGSDALMEWIESAAASQAHDYRLLSLSDDAHGDFIPVNFASDMEIIVELIGIEGGLEVLVFPPLINARRTAVQITNPQTFKEANVEKKSPAHQDPDGKRNNDAYEGIKDVYREPFAIGYNKSLLDAKRGRSNEGSEPSGTPPDKEQLRDMLTLAFWGGKHKFLPRDAAGNLNMISVMNLRDSRPNILRTNLHSLNGLMFQLGTKAQVDVLSRTKRVRIKGRRASGGDFNITSPDSTAMDQSFGSFFEKLPTASIRPPRELISSTPAGNFDKRVYVLESLIPFNYQTVNNEHWFRRRTEDVRVADNLSLVDLRRMVIRIRKNVDKTDPPRSDYEKAAALQWSFFETYDARLIPYRSAAALRSGNPAVNIPLHLVPNEQSKSAFYREIIEACDRGGNPLLGMEIFDKTGAKIEPQPIGCYNFIWDQLDPDSDVLDEEREKIRTVLYYGVPPQTPEVTVRFARPVFQSGTATAITLALKDDPWGLRLEFVPSAPLAEVSFDTLVCSKPSGAPDDPTLPVLAERLAPGLAFHGDLQFQFAQSVSSMETSLQVTYPTHTEPANPADANPEQEYSADLVNHNAMHAVAFWERREGGLQRSVEVNPAGQIFPVGKDGPPLKHFFKIDYRFPIDPPPVREGEAKSEVRAFFTELYRDMGTQRRYQLDLEHTYGTSFRLDDLGSISSHVDFTVATPTEVRAILSEPGATPAPCDSDSPTPLLTIDYDAQPCPGAPANSECVALIFNDKLLDLSLYDSERCRSTYIEAWRAIAELARSERLMLRGRFYKFDFRAGIAQNRPGRIADALKLIEHSEEWCTEIGAIVSRRCREWLATGVINEPQLKIRLAPFKGKRIGEVCHVCEFQLEVSRPQEMQPPEKVWQLKRLRPEPDTREGQRTEIDREAGVARLFDNHLKSLRTRQTLIEPAKEDLDRSEDFRRIVGEPSGQAKQGSAWILPNKISPPTSNEKAVPSVCPLGFLPLKKNVYLGDATTTLLRRYFAALKMVIEIGVPGVWSTWSRELWVEFFDGLHRLTADEASPLRRMVGKLQDLVFPIPPSDLPSDGPAQNPEIKNVVLELKRDSDLREQLRSWLFRRLLSDPSIFNEAKALLYTRLRGEKGTELLTQDFYELNSHKLIRTIPVSGNPEPQKVTDKDRYTFRQSLTRLSETRWFGFAEVLDDVRYDNEFQFENFQLRSFEDVIEQVGDSALQMQSSITIKDGLLHLPCNLENSDRTAVGAPCGAQKLGEELSVGKSPLVRLTSRETLSVPVHLFTSRLDKFEWETGIDRLVMGSKFSLRKLQEGKFDETLVAGEPTAQLRAKSRAFNRSPRRDDYVLTSIFTIRSDEESVNDADTPENIVASFSNDRFFANRLVNLNPAGATSAAGAPEAPIERLFKTLSDNPKLNRLEDPRDVINPVTIGFVDQALTKVGDDSSQQNLPTENEFRICSSDSDSQLVINFVKKGEIQTCNLIDEKLQIAEVMLFSIDQGQASPAQTLPQSYVIIVNLQVPVWQPSSIGLVHKRNVFADFAPEFGQVSALISDVTPYQPIIERDFATPAAHRLNRSDRRLSVADLVKLVLQLGDDYRLADEVAWRDYDLSVKTIHRQQTQVRVLLPGVKSLVPLMSPSPFPLLNRFIRGKETNEQNQKDIWFPSDYNDFIVELQWSSSSNLQFFSVKNFFVSIDP